MSAFISLRTTPRINRTRLVLGGRPHAQSRAEPRPRAIVGERARAEAAEEQRRVRPLRDEPAREVRAAVDGSAGRLQLLAPVPILRRLDLAEEVAQVEEAVDAAQEHLQLEEDLLASGDLQAADPAFTLGEVHRAHPLRVAHQLEEEGLREGAPVRPARRQRTTLTAPILAGPTEASCRSARSRP